MHLPPWLEDIIDQLSIAVILRESPIGAGKRLSLIVIDNAVEYMLKVYVLNKKLVGTKQGQLSHKDWEDKRRDFNKLIWFVKARANLSDDMVQTIFDYHKMRNDLYHDAKPQAPYKKHFDDYLKLARELLIRLFNRTLGPSEWSKYIEAIRQQIFGQEIVPTKVDTKTQVTIDASKSAITFDSKVELSLPLMILIVVYGYLQKNQKPTIEDISSSLDFSGHYTEKENIRKRLWDLVDQGKLTKINKQYSMKSKGRSTLQDKFILEVG